MGYSKPDQVLRRSEARLADRKKEKIRRTISGSWMMASKAAAKAVEAVKSGRPKVKAMTLAERMVWEKYNKPNRNLYQALGAFENNGVGQRVQPIIWKEKGYKDCYYTVTEFRPRFTVKGLHGRARGILTWKGRIINDGKDEEIRKALKTRWRVMDPETEA